MQRKWTVRKKERGESLENFIYRQLGDLSHKQVKTMIDRRGVWVNGRQVIISKWNLKPGDTVQLKTDKPLQGSSNRPSGKYAFVQTLYEDQFIVITDKPPFVDFETYAGDVADYLKRQNKATVRPYLGQMHRLDRDTSGVMVFTKKKIANTIADQFRAHTLRKKYQAILQGRLERENGVVDVPLEKGEFGEGKRVRVAKRAGKAAVSRFRVLERYPTATLVEVEIETGRTHQIRVHFASLGHPVVGDKVYGKPDGEKFRRQALHACELTFNHPISGKKLKIKAPLPADMHELLDRLRSTV